MCYFVILGFSWFYRKLFQKSVVLWKILVLRIESIYMCHFLKERRESPVARVLANLPVTVNWRASPQPNPQGTTQAVLVWEARLRAIGVLGN